MNKAEKAEKAAALEGLARRRAVKGWAFRDLPEAENRAIIAFLEGGECPEDYVNLWNLARRQLRLE